MQKKSLGDKLNERLKAGKFRLLNEKLYLSNPINMTEYHSIYKTRMQSWKYHPLSTIIPLLNKNDLIIDLGCGDGLISKKLPKVINIDRYSTFNDVIRCDINNLPLKSKIADCCVFSLSLMLKDCTKPILESHRILKEQGKLFIAELSSRIKNVDIFNGSMRSVGFKIVDYKLDQWYFIAEYVKTDQKKIEPVILQPCFYKKR